MFKTVLTDSQLQVLPFFFNFVNIEYKNYKGEKRWRKIKVICGDYWGQTSFYPSVQRLLPVFDLGKLAERTLAVSNILNIEVDERNNIKVYGSGKQYETLMHHVDNKGVFKSDRTGTGTKSVFGYQMRFDLQKGFPLVTTKKVFTKAVIQELLWFLRGETNVKSLQEQGVTIWDEWADEAGELGPVYGKQWCSWPVRYRAEDVRVDSTLKDGFINQIEEAIKLLKTNPDSRRIIVSAWNVAELDQMALMPCHVLFQFYVAEGKLSCQLYQRSADIFLGVPFNIASYALLTHMVAQQCDLQVGEFIWTGGDCHLYSNHSEQVKEQLSRHPLPYSTLKIARKPDSIFDYRLEDFEFLNYHHHPAIKAPVAV